MKQLKCIRNPVIRRGLISPDRYDPSLGYSEIVSFSANFPIETAIGVHRDIEHEVALPEIARYPIKLTWRRCHRA